MSIQVVQINPNLEDNIQGRIYIGNETCEKLIPSIAHIEKVLNSNKELTLLTPYVTESGLIKLRDIFVALNNKKLKTIEVVANDYGVLYELTKYEFITPVLGRLLNKTKRATGINNTDILQEEYRFFRGSNVFNNAAYRQHLMNDLGVFRCECDYPSFGLEFPNIDDEMRYSVYYPWVYVTSSRACPFAAMNQNESEQFKLSGPCDKECLEFYQAWQSEDPHMSGNIHAIGNAVFDYSSFDLETLIKNLPKTVTRLVIS
jgi:hypothetical protein